MLQWLRFHASNEEGAGSIPGQGTKIPHASWCGQKEKRAWGWGGVEIMQHLLKKKKAQPVIPDQNTGAESRCSFGISRPWCPWEEPCDKEAGGWAPGEQAPGCCFLP